MATSATIVYLIERICRLGAFLSPIPAHLSRARKPHITMHILKTHHRKLFIISLLLIADLAVFCLVNTASAPSFMLIIGFLLLSATIYWMYRGLFALSRIYGIKFKRQKRITLVLTIMTAGLFALQSIGQLGPKDIIVAIIIAGVYYLYSTYTRSPETSRSQLT